GIGVRTYPTRYGCYPAGTAELSPAQLARYFRLGLKRGSPKYSSSTPVCRGSRSSASATAFSKTRVVLTRPGSPRVLVGQEETFPPRTAWAAFCDIGIAYTVAELRALCRMWDTPLRGRIVT